MVIHSHRDFCTEQANIEKKLNFMHMAFYSRVSEVFLNSGYDDSAPKQCSVTMAAHQAESELQLPEMCDAEDNVRLYYRAVNEEK